MHAEMGFAPRLDEACQPEAPSDIRTAMTLDADEGKGTVTAVLSCYRQYRRYRFPGLVLTVTSAGTGA